MIINIKKHPQVVIARLTEEEGAKIEKFDMVWFSWLCCANITVSEKLYEVFPW